MKPNTFTLAIAIALTALTIGCQKEISFEGDLPNLPPTQQDSSQNFLNATDENDHRLLTRDTVVGVINLPINGLYDMDMYAVDGPATIAVVNYDATKWPCPLLLKEYTASGGGVPVQSSLTHKITVATYGRTTIAVQKAKESCQGIVPYKIVIQ